ncbi:hypothetical protein H920_04108 [Fukomys damarensis]|uniref:Uncharacterized protein n=1 Tax=Fukomys damarensis TaxID=885580 RepID=A0A091DQS5_FUKDA|nr:hypothetical protein H920_04108 [Fukomys damarensis]
MKQDAFQKLPLKTGDLLDRDRCASPQDSERRVQDQCRGRIPPFPVFLPFDRSWGSESPRPTQDHLRGPLDWATSTTTPAGVGRNGQRKFSACTTCWQFAGKVASASQKPHVYQQAEASGKSPPRRRLTRPGEKPRGTAGSAFPPSHCSSGSNFPFLLNSERSAFLRIPMVVRDLLISQPQDGGGGKIQGAM